MLFSAFRFHITLNTIQGRLGALWTNGWVVLEGIRSGPKEPTGYRNGLPIECLWKFDPSASCALQLFFCSTFHLLPVNKCVFDHHMWDLMDEPWSKVTSKPSSLKVLVKRNILVSQTLRKTKCREWSILFESYNKLGNTLERKLRVLHGKQEVQLWQ